MAASNVTIRPLRADERADWEPLWKGYQAFYKVVIPDQTTAVTWARLHDPAEAMGVFGAYMNGRLCGIVHLPLPPFVLDGRRLLLSPRSVRRRRRAQSWGRTRPDPGGRGQSTGRWREPRLLAHP